MIRLEKVGRVGNLYRMRFDKEDADKIEAIRDTGNIIDSYKYEDIMVRVSSVAHPAVNLSSTVFNDEYIHVYIFGYSRRDDNDTFSVPERYLKTVENAIKKANMKLKLINTHLEEWEL